MAISCWILCVATIGTPAEPGIVSRREGSAPRDAGMGNDPHPLCPCGPRAYFDGPCGGLCSTAVRSKCRPIAPFTMPIPSAPHTASHEPRGFYNDAARHVATNAPAPTIDGQRAGKSSRKPRRPRPYSRHLRGYHCDPNVVPLPPPCAYRAPRMPPPKETLRFLQRRAASLRSSVDVGE